MEPTAAGTYSESLLSIAPQNASCSPCLGVDRGKPSVNGSLFMSEQELCVMLRVVPLLAGLLALIGCATSGWQTHIVEGLGSRYKAGRVDVSAEIATAQAKPSATSITTEDEVRIVVPESGQVYLFSRASHPAHPGIIVLDPAVDGVVPFDAFAGGDLAAFEGWLMRIAAERAEVMAAHGSQ